jgi:very-short-patch-repair endonuclease
LCIEFDGEGHFREISWGKGRDESLEDIRLRDELKTKLIKEHGLNMLRFRFDEPLEAEHVKERLTEFIELD